jgi:hypothetical protein
MRDAKLNGKPVLAPRRWRSARPAGERFTSAGVRLAEAR